jgi:acetyl esterase/lipase
MTYKSLALSFSAAILATSVDATTVYSDISYGPGDRNTMDLYLPDGVENAPVVVFIHGGRWFRGDKSQIELYDRVESLTQAGIGIASINYTYSSEAIWPQQIDDVMAALHYVNDNGGTYGYDASRMAVWGQSSGAHLALWAGLKSAEDPDLDLATVVSWYAPSDLFSITADRVADDVPGENERFPEPSPESLLIGLPVPDNKPEADAASPQSYAASLPDGKPLPDFLLTHGTQDFVISPLQTQRMYDTLIAQGGSEDVQLRWVVDGRHGGDLFGPEADYTAHYLADKLGAVAPVPVPASLPLILAGMGAFALMRRRTA